jgi:hypothetical protein
MNTFRKYLTVFYLVMMIGVSSTAFAQSIVTTPNHVIVGHNGMYIKTAEGLVPVNSIVESLDGCLVAVLKPKADYEDIEWSCPRCGTTNTGDGVCSSCGWPLYDDEDV